MLGIPDYLTHNWCWVTKKDVIMAAFKVWGQDFYRTTSLSEIARELGVSKPAMYRHFVNKKALFEDMFTFYIENFVSFVREGYECAISEKDSRKSILIMTRTIVEYYIRNREAFIFSLFRVFNSRYGEKINNELRARGIDFRRLSDREKGDISHPSKIFLIVTTLIFCIAQYHRLIKESGEISTDDLIKSTIIQVESWVTGGLNLDASKVAALDYSELEKRMQGTVYEETENNALLKAVAWAVAEAGPWDASMEMVAKHSGISKSGLYAHFKNKQDMLMQLFMTEFTRIVDFAKMQIETTEEAEEQLYLAIISIVDYLKSRPEILVALEWIKTGRLELGNEMTLRLYTIIQSLKLEAIQNFNKNLLVWIAQWILFLIVNTLTIQPKNYGKNQQNEALSFIGMEKSKDWAKNIIDIPNESFRILFRFIALGLGGLNNN